MNHEVLVCVICDNTSVFFRPANVSLVILQALLDAKADPNVVDDTGRTALSWAVTNQPGEYVCF